MHTDIEQQKVNSIKMKCLSWQLIFKINHQHSINY